MRFVHTGDWHLGRLFHSVHLTDDQRSALDGLVRLAEERSADAVVVAGDVFDRAVPPTEAVELLDDVVARLALDLGVSVVMIAGNHDSAVRLEYLSGLASRAGVYVVGRVGAEPRAVELTGADGVSVRFWPLAYTDPETARCELGLADIHSHEAALSAQLERVRARTGGGARDVLVGHAFVTGAAVSDSERPLTVGGTGEVSAALFDGFDYAALGHLHRPQTVGSARVRYAGSLLKYSFEETQQVKSFAVVDLGADGGVEVDEVAVTLRRDLVRLEGTLDELLDGPADPTAVRAYVEVVLTDEEPVLDPMDKLRAVYPHVLSLRRARAEADALGVGPGREGVRTASAAELFASFFEDVTGEPLSDPQSAELASVLEGLERAEREAAQ